MSLKRRLKKLEGNGAGFCCVDVFPACGEGAEAALARTLKELGIDQSKVGLATLWPDPDGNGPITTLIDRVGGDPDGLIGHVSHETVLAELD